MNPRITAATVGIIILALGLTGLLFPDFVRVTLLGFAVDPSHSINAVKGEVRATYGGMVVVMGLFTLLAARDPAANRSRLIFVGLLCWGASAGRLLGAYLDGDPGVTGWVGVAFETVLGGALLIASFSRVRTAAPAEAPVAVTPSAAPLPPS